MADRRRRRRRVAGVWSIAALLAAFAAAAPAHAAGIEDEGGAAWRLEALTPPELPNGEHSNVPIGLGHVGDIEFSRPGRGLLITAGNGASIPAGVWAFNGLHWHELSTVCGASDGQIAWASAEEFWTVSDERAGQAPDNRGNPAPTEDNSLCHFAGGSVVASYAAPAFQAGSYQPMHAAACINAGDCWFAGDALPEPQVGAFHLHWNGRAGTLEAAPYPGEGRPVESLAEFGGALYEGVRISNTDPVAEHSPEPPPVHLINPLGLSPVFEPLGGLPLYSPNEFPEALDALKLSSGGESLWAAAGPRRQVPEGSEAAIVTVDRYTATQGWQQLVGPLAAGGDPFAGLTVRSLAAEPQGEAAWLALAPTSETTLDPTASAQIARVSSDGSISDELTLPSAEEQAAGVGPKGAAAKITCPAVHECWLVTTEGWLFRLTSLDQGASTPEGLDTDPAFAGLITYRPPDTGLPAVVSDAPPPEETPEASTVPQPVKPAKPRKTVALVSKVKVKLLHGTTLQLRFHLTVKARVKLLARRRRTVVSATRAYVLKAGFHTLELQLRANRWPTGLDLQTHALAPLPTVEVNLESGSAITASLRPAGLGGAVR